MNKEKEIEALIRAEAITYADKELDPDEYPVQHENCIVDYQVGTKSPARIEQIVRRTVELAHHGIIENHEFRYKTPEEILAVIMKEINETINWKGKWYEVCGFSKGQGYCLDSLHVRELPVQAVSPEQPQANLCEAGPDCHICKHIAYVEALKHKGNEQPQAVEKVKTDEEWASELTEQIRYGGDGDLGRLFVKVINAKMSEAIAAQGGK